jgi:hypothetical protein
MSWDLRAYAVNRLTWVARMSPVATQSHLDELLDEKQLCKLIRKSLATVKRDRANGRGPTYMKLGKLIRYDPRDVREYLERCRIPQPATRNRATT